MYNIEKNIFLSQRIEKLTKPSHLWGPADESNRLEYERHLNNSDEQVPGYGATSTMGTQADQSI